MMFYASYGKPKLEFICNHDAILRLTLKEGHYNTEFSKGGNNPAIMYVTCSRRAFFPTLMTLSQ